MIEGMDNPAIRNNGGGYWNHSLFWKTMSPSGGGEPQGNLANTINDQFGSFSEMKEQVKNAAMTRFGSGWAWLCVLENGKLENSSVSFGGITLSLGGSEPTPAFDLTSAINYPTSSLTGTITNDQLAGSIDLTSKVTNILPVANGGTGASSLNDLITLGNHTTGNYVATISDSARIGIGNIILPNTYIGPNVSIGDNNYITCGTHLNHDTKILKHYF